MDGADLFRKLGLGAKFNFNRFRQDAEKLKIIKPKAEIASSRKRPLDLSRQQAEEAEHVLKKQKSDNVTVSESENEAEDADARDEDEPLQILGNIRGTGEEEGTVPRAGKEKKKRNKKTTPAKLAQLKQEQVNHFRRQHRIHVYGSDVPDPVRTFAQLENDCGMHHQVIKNLEAVGFSAPTAIQMQAIPVMMQRREVLACAPTGSGKTAAFILPILHHLKEPRRQGIRALVLAPTRELARQTHREFQRLGEGRGFHAVFIEKTSTKHGSSKSMNKFDIMVTTPNRLVYMLQQEPPMISLAQVEWLVVDESDKLFEEGKTGFRDQLAVIYKACDSKNVRRAMFSATFAYEVEQWCKLNLDNVVQVYIGARNVATETVEQELQFVGSESGKLLAIRDIIRKGLQPPVLIFVQSKERAKELFHELIYDGINVDVIHADRTQLQRDNVVKSFRAGKIWVLICTELMGRGMDFKGVNLVINYDFPNSAISYIHRIGRTGRAGRRGKATTFFTENDAVYLRSIANIMREAGCPVPEYMLQMNKPNQRERRQLARKAPKRNTICTLPKREVRKARKQHKMEKRLEQKQKGQGHCANPNKGTATESSGGIPRNAKDFKVKRKNFQQGKKQTVALEVTTEKGKAKKKVKKKEGER